MRALSVSLIFLLACGDPLEKQETELAETFTEDLLLVIEPLANRTPVELAGAKSSEHHFVLGVPTGATALVFEINGTAGDADLYVRRDAPPTVDHWDFRPYRSNSIEKVTPGASTAGLWFVMVRGYSDYRSLTLNARFDLPGMSQPVPGISELQRDAAISGLTGEQNSERHFYFRVPENIRALTFAISGGTGDADLYVRYAQPATRTSWDYRPYTGSNNERVEPMLSTAGVWYAMIRGYRAYTELTLVARYELADPDGAARTFEDRVLVLLNDQRALGATCGTEIKPPVGPLAMNENLRTAARGHSEDMGGQNYFAHQSVDGRSFDQRMRDAGYDGASPWGENIAAGAATPEEAMRLWMNSPGHCVNIMSPSFREVGVGYGFAGGSTYRHYWTQDFGGGPQ